MKQGLADPNASPFLFLASSHFFCSDLDMPFLMWILMFACLGALIFAVVPLCVVKSKDTLKSLDEMARQHEASAEALLREPPTR